MIATYEPPSAGTIPVVAVQRRAFGSHTIRCVEATGKPLLEDVVRAAALEAGMDGSNVARELKRGVEQLVNAESVVSLSTTFATRTPRTESHSVRRRLVKLDDPL